MLFTNTGNARRTKRKEWMSNQESVLNVEDLVTWLGFVGINITNIVMAKLVVINKSLDIDRNPQEEVVIEVAQDRQIFIVDQDLLLSILIIVVFILLLLRHMGIGIIHLRMIGITIATMKLSSGTLDLGSGIIMIEKCRIQD